MNQDDKNKRAEEAYNEWLESGIDINTYFEQAQKNKHRVKDYSRI